MEKTIFRKNVSKKINEIVNNEKMSINIEKSIFNFTITQAKSKNIIKKWENKYFLQIYKK